MNPSSTLIAGGVLLFGAAGLSNLLLPPPTMRTAAVVHPIAREIASEPPSAVRAPIAPPAATTAAEVASTPPAPAPAATVSSTDHPVPEVSGTVPGLTPVPVQGPAVIAGAPVPASPRPLPPEVARTAPAAPQTVSARAHDPLGPPKDVPVRDPGEHRSRVARSLTPAPGAPAAEPTPETSISGAARGASVDRVTTVDPEPTSFVLSATLEDRAWIRIGDRRTVAVKAGDEVPGLGKIAQVSANAVTLESGASLKVQP